MQRSTQDLRNKNLSILNEQSTRDRYSVVFVSLCVSLSLLTRTDLLQSFVCIWYLAGFGFIFRADFVVATVFAP